MIAGRARTAVPMLPSEGTGARVASKLLWSSTRPFRPVLILLVLLFVVLSLKLPAFATATNLQNMLVAVAELWIISIGMTFALLSGGVDLSVTANGALAGIFMAKVIGQGVPAAVAIVLAVLFGALVSAVVNGVLIGAFGLSFFVVTLASMTTLTGVDSLWTHTLSINVTSNAVGDLAVGHLAGLDVPIWIMLFVFVVFYYVQRYTYFGRDVYAVGGSLTAARLSGIRTSRTIVAVYAVTGATAAFAGIILVGSIGAASPQVDGTLPLEAVAAVLLGGTALTGGAGSIVGTGLGVLFIGELQNGLSIGGVSGFWQQVVTGIILVAAVLGTSANGSRRSLSSRALLYVRKAQPGTRPIVDVADDERGTSRPSRAGLGAQGGGVE